MVGCSVFAIFCDGVDIDRVRALLVEVADRHGTDICILREGFLIDLDSHLDRAGRFNFLAGCIHEADVQRLGVLINAIGLEGFDLLLVEGILVYCQAAILGFFRLREFLELELDALGKCVILCEYIDFVTVGDLCGPEGLREVIEGVLEDTCAGYGAVYEVGGSGLLQEGLPLVLECDVHVGLHRCGGFLGLWSFDLTAGCQVYFRCRSCVLGSCCRSLFRLRGFDFTAGCQFFLWCRCFCDCLGLVIFCRFCADDAESALDLHHRRIHIFCDGFDDFLDGVNDACIFCCRCGFVFLFRRLLGVFW